MSGSKYRAELLELMQDAKIYQLPPFCKCGYKAKNGNWIDMEKHYEICGQYRNTLMIESKKQNK